MTTSIGLDAVTREGKRLGRVAALSNHGAGDIVEIMADGGGETLLLPFTRRVAPTIDFDAGQIVIDLPREIEGEED